MNFFNSGMSFSFSPIPKIIVIAFFSFNSSQALNIFSISFMGFEGHISLCTFGLTHSTAPQTPWM